MKVYLYQGSQDILMQSSSGGAFASIVHAFYDIYPDGLCFGAAFDSNLNVKHSLAASKEDTNKFRTSKYCFSEFSNTLPIVKEKLDNGKAVLFSGTPCQVDVLKRYLTKKKTRFDLLYTIDLLCHGTPDDKWWIEYKDWLEKKNKSSLTFFSFRWKEARWHGYSLCAKFSNGKKKVNTHDLQVYMDLYFTHQIMKKRCYKCQFTTTNRISDISLGDFWGAQEIFNNLVSRKQAEMGLSLVMCNSNKGENLFELVKTQIDSVNFICKCDNIKYVKYQTALREPVKKPNNNQAFIDDYKKNGFEYIITKYAGFNQKGHLRFAIKWLANQLGVIR